MGGIFDDDPIDRLHQEKINELEQANESLKDSIRREFMYRDAHVEVLQEYIEELKEKIEQLVYNLRTLRDTYFQDENMSGCSKEDGYRFINKILRQLEER